ncbi:MAG: RING finger protein [Candidatus Odinarchaeota archaeon]
MASSGTISEQELNDALWGKQLDNYKRNIRILVLVNAAFIAVIIITWIISESYRTQSGFHYDTWKLSPTFFADSYDEYLQSEKQYRTYGAITILLTLPFLIILPVSVVYCVHASRKRLSLYKRFWETGSNTYSSRQTTVQPMTRQMASAVNHGTTIPYRKPVRDTASKLERRSSSSKRLLRKITPEETRTRWQFTKEGDTCWSCGKLLAVESMTCRSCGERRLICSICRKNIDREDRIGACPACGNHFHYPHLREAVKVTGVCPTCRNRVRMEEVIELGKM